MRRNSIKDNIDPALLDWLPEAPPRPMRPPPIRPDSPASLNDEADHHQYQRPVAVVDPDHRFQSHLSYLSHFPTPPKTPPRSQRNNKCDTETTVAYPSLPRYSQLHRSRSLGGKQPINARLTKLDLPSPNGQQPSSSSLSSSLSTSNTHEHSIENRPSLQSLTSSGRAHNLTSSPALTQPPFDRTRSFPSPGNQESCADSVDLGASSSKKVEALEFGEHWISHASQLESEDSKPIDHIAADLEYSFRRLISLDVFERLLEDPAGQRSFRQAIIDGLSSDPLLRPELSLSKLDLWLDCRGISHLLQVIRSCSLGLNDLYLDPNSSPLSRILPDSVMNQLTNSIQAIQSLEINPLPNHKKLEIDGSEQDRRKSLLCRTVEDEQDEDPDNRGGKVELKSTENYLLRSLYQNEFVLFIKKTLISNVKVRLGKIDLNDTEQDGLGECFCLTNPRLRDHPIVLVSEGFTKVTGYERNAIVGKNCRFLQGPGTSPQSVQRIRDGLNSGEGCTELILNYRKDGTPFYCLLAIIPFRDVTGALIYFIGGQINVTGMLSSKKGLSFLLTNPNDRILESSAQGRSNDLLGLSERSLSQNMQHYSSQEKPFGFETESVLRDMKNSTRLDPSLGDHSAAGSITFDTSAMSNKENSSFPKRFLRRLAGMNTTRDQKAESAMLTHNPTMLFAPKNVDQRLLGAEGLFQVPKPLTDQIKKFESTYSQLLIFKRDSRRVIFATKEVIELFDLNKSRKHGGVFKSKLIQTDFIELIWSLTPHLKPTVSHLRGQLKEIIKCGVAVTMDCQVAFLEQRSFFMNAKDESIFNKLKPVKIHLTPLKDKDGIPAAFTCLFSPML